jgi:hypothetical protein
VRSARADVFDCDEPGVQAAVVTGGGPHTFSCPGPTTVTVTTSLYADGFVILDGEGLLTLSGGDALPLFQVAGYLELHNLVMTEGNNSSTNGGCIQVYGTGTLLIAGSSVTDCHTLFNGGGISNEGSLTVTDSVIAGNTAGFTGGGIAMGLAFPSNSASVSGSRISGNTAVVGGGLMVWTGTLSVADTTFSGNSANSGGGLAALATNVGPLVVTGSTFSGNTATQPDAHGAAIHSQASSLTIRNSTLAGNTGGAISNTGSVLLDHTTISDNTAAFGSGTAIYNPSPPSGIETLRNSIVAGTCTSAPRPSQGGNVESPGNTCGLTDASDQVGVSAPALNLGSLGDHGGPTHTVPVMSPSAAIGAAVSCPPPATDQRGVPRPQGPGCDSGAYEAEVAVPLVGLAWLAIALATAGALALRRAPAAVRTRR